MIVSLSARVLFFKSMFQINLDKLLTETFAMRLNGETLEHVRSEGCPAEEYSQSLGMWMAP